MQSYDFSDQNDYCVKARLKWFDRKKGFGFVVPEHQGHDVFLHVTALRRAGITALGEEACLLCRVEQRTPGWAVTDILELLDEGREVTALGEEPPRKAATGGDTFRLDGVIKFYRHDKGFGFVCTADGDVFLHRRCIERHGLKTIEAGQRIAMTVMATPESREVVEFEFLDGPDNEAGE